MNRSTTVPGGVRAKIIAHVEIQYRAQGIDPGGDIMADWLQKAEGRSFRNVDQLNAMLAEITAAAQAAGGGN